jgi:hypothetical protein
VEKFLRKAWKNEGKYDKIIIEGKRSVRLPEERSTVRGRVEIFLPPSPGRGEKIRPDLDSGVRVAPYAVCPAKYAAKALSVLSPTLDFNCGYIKRMPVAKIQDAASIDRLVKGCVELSTVDCDGFEVSWNFKRHSLV